MKAVGRENTSPERKVRLILREVGAHYRLHNKDLPGTPDLANRKKRWAVFVNGCFWHGHKNCKKTKGGRGSRIPLSNRSFWAKKLEENRRRDAKKCRELRKLNYRVLLVWECELKNPDQVANRLAKILLKPR